MLAISGCQTPDHSVGRIEQPIYAGVASGAADDAVVRITTGVSLCSGALVAPNLVLTARQCLLELSSIDGLCYTDGTSQNGTNETPTSDVDPSRIEIQTGAIPAVEPAARGTEILSTDSPTFCRNNIALVVLDRRLDGWPTLPIRLTRPTAVGETMTLIGYGVTRDLVPAQGDADGGDASLANADGGDANPADAGSLDSGGGVVERHRREGVPVLELGDNRFNAGAGGIATGTLLLGPGMCRGDSGGPAISEATGAIVGVGSLIQQESCASSTTSIYTLVAEYYDLVLEAFIHAGSGPWIEGETGAMQLGPTERSGCSLVTPRTSPLGVGSTAWLLWIAAVIALGRCRGGRERFDQKRPKTSTLFGASPTVTCLVAAGRGRKNV